MVGVASAGAGFGVGGAAGGAAAFAGNTGENCGGPVFFDGFVFCRGALAPAALSLRSRSCRAGEPLLMFDAGDAAFLPPDVGRGIGSLPCDCCGCRRLATPLLVRIVIQVACPPWLPEGRHALFWCDSTEESQKS